MSRRQDVGLAGRDARQLQRRRRAEHEEHELIVVDPDVIADRLDLRQDDGRHAAGSIEAPQPLRLVGLDANHADAAPVGRHRWRVLTLRRGDERLALAARAVELVDVGLLAVANRREQDGLAVRRVERLIVIPRLGTDRLRPGTGRGRSPSRRTRARRCPSPAAPQVSREPRVAAPDQERRSATGSAGFASWGASIRRRGLAAARLVRSLVGTRRSRSCEGSPFGLSDSATRLVAAWPFGHALRA